MGMSTRDLVVGILLGATAVIGLAIAVPVLAGAVFTPQAPSGMPGSIGGMGMAESMDHQGGNTSGMDHGGMMDQMNMSEMHHGNHSQMQQMMNQTNSTGMRHENASGPMMHHQHDQANISNAHGDGNHTEGR